MNIGQNKRTRGVDMNKGQNKRTRGVDTSVGYNKKTREEYMKKDKPREQEEYILEMYVEEKKSDYEYRKDELALG